MSRELREPYILVRLGLQFAVQCLDLFPFSSSDTRRGAETVHVRCAEADDISLVPSQGVSPFFMPFHCLSISDERITEG